MGEELNTTLNGRSNPLLGRIEQLERRLDGQEGALVTLRRGLEQLQAKLSRLGSALSADAKRECQSPARAGAANAGLSCGAERPETLTPAELVSSLAHELNQPLTAIAAYGRACLRLVRSGQGDAAEVADALEQIAEQAEHAGRFLNHVREQLLSGRPVRIPVHLNAQIEGVVRRLGQRIALEQTHLQFDLADRLPPVLGDPLQLEQVLLNLIQNALEAMRATPAGQRVLTIRSTREEGEVTVAVSDTGGGLSADMARRLFQPFQTTKVNGMGLGLALCQSIIRAHRGRLGAAPNAGPGTTFFFSLPSVPGAE